MATNDIKGVKENAGGTYDEVLLNNEFSPALTFGIANTNKVQINAADVADNDYAKFTATGLEGRSYSEVASDIGAITGTGTDGYLPNWNGTTGLENSPVYTDGTSVGIGTTIPLNKLDIVGASTAYDAQPIFRISTGSGLDTDEALWFAVHTGN
jgi:hypothetical protein